MPKKSPAKKHSALLRIVLSVVLLAAAAYVLAANWHTVHASADLARSANKRAFMAGVFLMFDTFMIAAAIYGVLALHQLRYGQTLLVEVSTAFVNRLLPSGLGGLGLHGDYLYKRKHTAAEATAVVSVNNLLGMGAHLLLLLLVLGLRPDVVRGLFDKHHLTLPWQPLLVLAIIIAVVMLLPKVRLRVDGFVKNLLVSFRKMRPRNVMAALGLAILLTTTYTAILLSSAYSVGIDLSLLQIFIVFSIGMLTSTATPTPGGLVGAEAGLFAGFVAYGVPATQAAAAVLLYRLVTYWLPLIPGVFALLAARKRKLV